MPRCDDPRRIWILSELYAPELTSTGYFVTRIAEHLALDPTKDVRAIVSQPTYAARGIRAPAREMLRGVKVQRCWSPAFAKDRILGRLGNLTVFTALVCWTLVRSLRKHDIVFVVTNPPPLPYLAAAMARLRGARVILLVHDLYPEVLVAGGLAREQSPIIRFLHQASRWLYHASDRIVVLGRDMQKLIRNKLHTTVAEKVVIIPNWASLDEIQPSDITDRIADVPFTIQMAGNMGRGHNIEILLDAARRLPDIQFMFVGAGAKRQWLEQAVANEALKNVRIANYRPREQLSESLGDCDVAAIAFVPKMAGVSVPSRLYNVMASGRPVVAICEHDSELASVVTEEQIGWVVLPTDTERLVQIIIEATQARSTLDEMGTRARRAAETRYSETAIMQAYDTMFQSL